MINSSRFLNSFLKRGSFDSVIIGKASKPILNAELIVAPPMFKAAIPVGATTIFLRSFSSIIFLTKVVFPVPAAPVR